MGSSGRRSCFQASFSVPHEPIERRRRMCVKSGAKKSRLPRRGNRSRPRCSRSCVTPAPLPPRDVKPYVPREAGLVSRGSRSKMGVHHEKSFRIRSRRPLDIRRPSWMCDRRSGRRRRNLPGRSRRAGPGNAGDAEPLRSAHRHRPLPREVPSFRLRCHHGPVRAFHLRRLPGKYEQLHLLDRVPAHLPVIGCGPRLVESVALQVTYPPRTTSAARRRASSFVILCKEPPWFCFDHTRC